MINIAIDGYSGSGKGTLAEGLAKKFKLKHLDTGSILRGMGLYFYEQGILNPTEKDIEKHIDDFDIKIEFDGKIQKTLLNGKDVSKTIRMEQIGQMASRVAVHQLCMQKVIDVSREFASNYDCVVDGRNITSAVLPNADVKIFLDADLSCRAKRRHKENIEKGLESNLEQVSESLKERDYRDTHRDFSPMIVVYDALVIDNTKLNEQETIELVSEKVEQKLKELGKIR